MYLPGHQQRKNCRKPWSYLTIKLFKEEDSYKYHGQYENIRYVGPPNKAHETVNYKKRVRKIWSSELRAYNNTLHIFFLHYQPNTNFWNHLLDNPGKLKMTYYS